MGTKREPRTGPRLNTPNFIKTPSDAIKSVDYSPDLKVLEIEWRGDDGENKIYHYLNVNEHIYDKILSLKHIIDPLPKPLTNALRAKYSIQNFVTRSVKNDHDYYVLNILNEPK